MPVYDFRCQECKKRFDIRLTYAEYDAHQIKCPFCASGNVVRVIRKVRIARNDAERLSSIADDGNMDALDGDPRTLGRMMRQMKTEVGADDLPAEFDEVVDRLEKGQSPEEIERDLPDLGNDNGISDL